MGNMQETTVTKVLSYILDNSNHKITGNYQETDNVRLNLGSIKLYSVLYSLVRQAASPRRDQSLHGGDVGINGEGNAVTGGKDIV
jgi:hypothetical protein